MLVDVRLADRLRGQVQILDLLELAGPVVRRLLGRATRPGVCWPLVRPRGVRTAGARRIERAAGFLAPLRRGSGPGGTPRQVVPVGGVVVARSPGRGGTTRLVACV